MRDLLTFAAALLTITNPVGSLAIFAGLTGSMPRAEANATARLTAFAVAVVMLAVLWAGDYLLPALGVRIAGLQMAGGVIIALMGLSMLRGQTSRVAHTPEENDEAQSKPSIAVVPMAIPVIAGPGVMTTLLVATHKHPAALDKAAMTGICLAVAALIWLALRFAAPVAGWLGVAGVNVVTRLMGIVLTAIALEMLTAGLGAALPGLK